VAVGVDALATGGADGVMRLWKPDGGTLRSPKNLGDWVYAVALGTDDAVAFAGTWAGTVQRYDRESRKTESCDPWAPDLAPVPQ